MKYLSLILLIGSLASLSAQDTTTFESRRDWFVGKYEGLANYYGDTDTTTGVWVAESIEYTYYGIESIKCSKNYVSYKVCEDSITMFDLISVCEIADSLFNNPWNLNYIEGFAKLFPDSTLKFWYYSPPANGDYFYYFIGKKIESYVGINNYSENSRKFSVYPNPAKDEVRFAISKGELKDGRIEIFKINGERVISLSAGRTNSAVDVSALPKGIYIVRFTGDREGITEKLVLE